MGAHKEHTGARMTGARLRTFRLRARGRALVLVVAAELVLACSAFQRPPVTPGLRPAGECASTLSRRQCAVSGVRASGMTTGPGRLSAASEATTKALHPDKRGSVHFINLSNGIELLPMLQGIPASFVRIQSSHCEANNFNGILGGLDSTFLMYLAMGHDCYIYDLGSRNKKRKAPRAVWYGITFIKYALHIMWELPGEPPKPILRGHNAAAAFDKAIMFLDKAVKKKIKYYKNYVSTPELRLYGVVGATEIDGRRDLHAHLAFEFASASGGLVTSLDCRPWRRDPTLEVFDTALGFTNWDLE